MPGSALSRCTTLSRDAFATRHWSRTPLLSRGIDNYTDLLASADVDELIAERALREPFFRMVSGGQGVGRLTRSATAGNRRISDLVDADALSARHGEGATLVLQSLHRLHPPVVRFCRQLAAELGHPTQCNAYVTPGGEAQGFAFHHDTHDVFVLQVSGRKAWRVHTPVLELPLPSQPRAGDDLVADDAEPLLDVVLDAGDCLYLPRGYVHAARTTDEPSVHLTVGVLSTTWYDVLQDAAGLAAQEPQFRDALPIGPATALTELPRFLREVADWVAALPPEELAAAVRRRLARAVPAEPVRMLGQAAAVRGIDANTPVRLRQGLEVRLVDDRLILPDKDVRLPSVALPCLRLLLDGAVCTPRSLAGLDLGLDAADAVVLLRRLLVEGVLVPA